MTHRKRPDCPKCGDARAVYEHGDRNFWCRNCNFTFDDDPNEGGAHSNDPVRSAIHREERAKWEAKRKVQQRQRQRRARR